MQAGECLSLDRTFDVIILSETINFAADVQRIIENLAHGRQTTDPADPQFLQLAVATHARAGDRARSQTAFAAEQLAQPPRRVEPLRTGGLAGHQDPGTHPAAAGCARAGTALQPLARAVAAIVLPDGLPRGPAPTRNPCRAPPRVVSVIIPARNEAGNIEAAVVRTPSLGAGTEIIFVEGHSRDDTWAEIERVAAAYPGRAIRTLRQSGKGKGNAVREAFAVATGDILMILDADLTVPPEELPKFYRALVSGHAEFANGVRLVYPNAGSRHALFKSLREQTFRRGVYVAAGPDREGHALRDEGAFPRGL